jgi:hypothetical protein
MKCYICSVVLTATEENAVFVCICKRCLGFVEKSDVRKAEEMANLSNKNTELVNALNKIKKSVSKIAADMLERAAYYDGG